MKSKLRTLVFSLLVLLLCTLGCTALADDSNFISGSFHFAYRDGYMYFIGKDQTGCKLNDGRETGLPDSVEIYRIADVLGAQKELIASLPAAYVGGVILDPGAFITPTENALYYVREWPTAKHRTPSQLVRLDLTTGKLETIETLVPCASSSLTYYEIPYFTDGDQIYFMSYAGKPMTLNTKTNELKPWETKRDAQTESGRTRPLLSRQFNLGYVFDVEDGYFYYVSPDPLAEDPGLLDRYCISRIPVDGGESEVILPRTSDTSAAPFCFVQDNVLYFFNEAGTVECVDVSTRALIDRIALDPSVQTGNNYGARLNIADGKAYYLKSDGLYVKTVGREDETLLIAGDTEGMACLALGENYFYLTLNDRRVFRVPRAAHFFQEAEILLEDQYKSYDSLLQTENGWQFIEYENCVTIEDYIGDAAAAQAPATIHGKPVISVSLDHWSRKHEALQSLAIPEGVLRLGVISGKSLTDLSLPASLITMANDGYPYVFDTAEGCVVHYAGTVAEWQALDDRSWTDYATEVYSRLSDLRVLCSDGEWTDGTNVPTAAPTEAPTPTPTNAPTSAPEASEKLPKNVTRLPSGNLRYDDGLIAFEMPGDALIRKNNATYDGKTGLFPANTTLTGFRVMIPSTENLSGFYGYYSEETQKRYFDAVIAGVAQLPPEVDAAEFAWAAYEELPNTGYTTVAGRTAKYHHLIAASGGTIINDLKENTEVLIPLSGNRNFIINYYEYPDAGRKNAVELFLNTLEIQDSLYAEPPTEQPAAPTEAPAAAPTAAPSDEKISGDDPGDYTEIWAHTWMRVDEPDTQLIVIPNGDGTLHMEMYFFRMVGGIEVNFKPYDYAGIQFEDTDGEFGGVMYFDPKTDNYLHLWIDNTVWPEGDVFYDYFQDQFLFTTEDMPDLSRYDWDFVDGDDGGEWYVSEEECQALFSLLSRQQFTASSGVGAWEGHLSIRPDGSFTGDYHDADADVIYQVSFSGNFIPSGTERWGNTTYGLWVENLKTENVPGTEGMDEYGDRIIYDDAPFYDRDYVRLTLPGTPDDEIPEMVRGEIGGTYWEWDDFSRFFTLTRGDGWGFFADESVPGTEDGLTLPATNAPTTPPAAAPTAAPTAAAPDLSAWAGCWMTHDDSLAELIITDNGNGTLSARTMYLAFESHKALLTPQADGALLYESEYGSLIGILSRQADGTLRLAVTGGYAFDDEEATEYYDYYARGFTYYPAAYEETWFNALEAPGTDDDWLGDWTIVNAGKPSTLHISRESDQLRLDTVFGPYRFTGLMEKRSNAVMDLYDDDFSCLLVLNRHAGRIAMMEAYSPVEAIYDWTDNYNYGITFYERTPEQPLSQAGKDLLSAADQSAVPPLTVLPVPTEAPQTGGLQTIPDNPGYLQVPVSRADATSYIVGKNDSTAYAPFRMTDGDETTAFQFSTHTTALGNAYLYFDFDSPVTLDEMWMKNGYWRYTDGKDQYARNCRVKKMTISLRYADGGDYVELKSVTLKDDGRDKPWKVIDLLGRRQVTGVRIRIDSVYKGSKFPNDVCISEIMFVQKK